MDEAADSPGKFSMSFVYNCRQIMFERRKASESRAPLFGFAELSIGLETSNLSAIPGNIIKQMIEIHLHS